MRNTRAGLRGDLDFIDVESDVDVHVDTLWHFSELEREVLEYPELSQGRAATSDGVSETKFNGDDGEQATWRAMVGDLERVLRQQRSTTSNVFTHG